MRYYLGTFHLRRRHVLGGEGGSPLPMFADARGGGVLEMPTSAIFQSICIKRQTEAEFSTVQCASLPCLVVITY